MDGYTIKPRAPALARSDGKARLVVPIPKLEPVRDEDYRRWVATLPCIRCGLEGYSQAAHGPSLGRGLKACDRSCVPLCADAGARQGCHSKVDQYIAYSRAERRERMAAWAREIQALWAERQKA